MVVLMNRDDMARLWVSRKAKASVRSRMLAMTVYLAVEGPRVTLHNILPAGCWWPDITLNGNPLYSVVHHAERSGAIGLRNLSRCGLSGFIRNPRSKPIQPETSQLRSRT